MSSRKTMAAVFVIAVICVGGLSVGGNVEKSEKETTKWIMQIKSSEENVRVAASKMLLRKRREDVSSLLSIMRGCKKDSNWLSTTTTASICIKVLGEMRSVEAVLDLMKWVFPPEGPYKVREFGAMSPAGLALVKIGKPSVPHLLKALETETNKEHRHICLRILEKIEGKEISAIILKQAVKKEKDIVY